MNNKTYPVIGPAYKKRRKNDRKDGKEWQVKPVANKQGATDLKNLVLKVPVGESGEDFRVRSHELLHVAFSPESVPVMDIAALAAEDARIETIASRKGVSPPPHGDISHIRQTIRTMVKNGDTTVFAYATAGIGSQDEERIRATLATMATDGELPEFSSALFTALGAAMQAGTKTGPVTVAAKKELAREVLDFLDWVNKVYERSTSRRAANRVARKIRELMDDDYPSTSLPGHGTPDLESPPDDTGEERPDTDGELPIALINPWTRKPARYTPSPDPALSWSEMTLEEPPRTRQVVHKEGHTGLGNSGIRPSDTGAVPRAMYRLVSDEKIFRKHRHTITGTVLIDTSASMRLSYEAIEEIVKKVPAATVAAYSGLGTNGTLRIIAKDGRTVRTDLMNTPGGGNQVDGPALEWLAEQSSPRIWICDGVITGNYDVSATQLMRDAAENTIHRGRITQVNPDWDQDWMQTAIKIMLGKA